MTDPKRVAEDLAELPRRIVDLNLRLGYADGSSAGWRFRRRTTRHRSIGRSSRAQGERIDGAGRRSSSSPVRPRWRNATPGSGSTARIPRGPGSTSDRGRRATSPSSKRGQPSNPGEHGPSAVPQGLLGGGHPDPVLEGERTPGPRREHRERGTRADGPGDRESRLGLAFRPALGDNATSNFGKLGDAPTSHPELLDDLTARFIAGGWVAGSGLHREIVLSATYRQASRHDPASQAVDPEDRSLWRAQRLRLDVEAWRDAILAITGALDPAMGGPSGDLEREGFTRPDRVRQGEPRAHGVPAPDLRLPRPQAAWGGARDLTTTPIQQLYLMNSPFLLGSAESLASDALKGAADGPARVRIALSPDPAPRSDRRRRSAVPRDWCDAAGTEPREGLMPCSPSMLPVQQ